MIRRHSLLGTDIADYVVFPVMWSFGEVTASLPFLTSLEGFQDNINNISIRCGHSSDYNDASLAWARPRPAVSPTVRHSSPPERKAIRMPRAASSPTS